MKQRPNGKLALERAKRQIRALSLPRSPRSPDVGDTPLNSNFWSDEDFEEIEEEIDEEEAGFG